MNAEGNFPHTVSWSPRFSSRIDLKEFSSNSFPYSPRRRLFASRITYFVTPDSKQYVQLLCLPLFVFTLRITPKQNNGTFNPSESSSTASFLYSINCLLRSDREKSSERLPITSWRRIRLRSRTHRPLVDSNHIENRHLWFPFRCSFGRCGVSRQPKWSLFLAQMNGCCSVSIPCSLYLFSRNEGYSCFQPC